MDATTVISASPQQAPIVPPQEKNHYMRRNLSPRPGTEGGRWCITATVFLRYKETIFTDIRVFRAVLRRCDKVGIR
ncbi:MAG: hypothetical protein JW913_10485 [Chitinispirillaceae bacterium]|nr:hypothetical protein [Chitinispirillaceae bacterium]